ncbi:hypothetical protein D3C75_1326340 [compost metagenome]
MLNSRLLDAFFIAMLCVASTVSDWAAIVTIIYISLQTIFVLRKQFTSESSMSVNRDAK